MNSYKNNKQAHKIPGWCIGLSIGGIFLLLGFFLGQYTDIFQKAVMICLECIGIG